MIKKEYELIIEFIIIKYPENWLEIFMNDNCMKKIENSYSFKSYVAGYYFNEIKKKIIKWILKN